MLLNLRRSALTAFLVVSSFTFAGLGKAFAVNNPPTIGGIPNQTVVEDQPTHALQLTLSDAETPVLNLQLSGNSSDTNLVPVGNIFFGDVAFLTNRYITVTPAFGKTGSATITVTVSDGTNSASTNFVLTVNPPPPGAVRFTNTSSIAIPGVGPATLYPSKINVTGMNGTITNLSLTLSRFSHIFIHDVSMLLVGPTNQGVVIFSHVAGANRATNVTVTLTDAAPYPLPFDFQLWPEPLRPTAYAPSASFPGAPVGPYGPVTFSTFNGQSANGTWSLYVYDEEAPDQGVIAGGWSLMIATTGGDGSPPEISDIPNQTVPLGTATVELPFTINDPDTPVENLTLSTNSTNPTLVPSSNIVLGGSGNNRTVTVTPVPGQTGTATITVTVSDGTNSASALFVLTINTSPTITGIANQTINEDASTGPLAFTVEDAESVVGILTLIKSSSNPALVPTNNIVLGGSGENRTVTVTPVANQLGTTTITLTVNDGQLSTNTSFVVTVNAVNDPPTISPITDKTTLTGDPVGPFVFAVADVDTPVDSLTVTGSSSNPTLVPNQNIVLFNGPGPRTLTATPADGQTGTTTITVIVSDGVASNSTPFLLTVSPPGPGTTIFGNPSVITIVDNTTATPYPSTISVTGVVGTISRLSVTLKGMSHEFPSDVDMLLVGPTGQKAVIFSDVGGGNAISNVTVGLSDAAAFSLPDGFTILTGTYKPTDLAPVDFFPLPAPAGPYASTLSTFNGLSANGVNGTWSLYVVDDLAARQGAISNGWSLAITTESAPTISDIPDVSTTLDTATTAIQFTIDDTESAESNLVLTATSSNPALAPTNNIVFGGSASNRTVTLTPASNQVGTATISVMVSDGTLTATDSFVLTVLPAELTVTGISADEKVYDGTTVATLNVAGAALVGLHGAAAVALNTGAAIGTFDSDTVGRGKPVAVAGLTITGADADKYTLTQPTTMANITARAITVTAATDTKIYDGTTTSTGVPTVTTGNLAAGDTGNFSQTFDNKNVGTGKTLTPAGSVNDGNSGANYGVTFAPNLTGVIVAPQPFILSLTGVGTTNVVIQWSAISDLTYRVQYQPDLNPTNWFDLVPDVTATNSTASAIDNPGGSVQRFYRILFVP